jgi:hypothetical protein
MTLTTLTRPFLIGSAAFMLLTGSVNGLAAPTASSAVPTCHSWSGGQPPNQGGSSAYDVMTSVAALSPCNVWAGGHYRSGSVFQTLIEHWNGTSWKILPSPDPGGSARSNQVFGIAALASGRAWAVGYYDDGIVDQTLIERWNGTSWKTAPSVNVGGSDRGNQLFGVAATSRGGTWAVGDFSDGATVHTLIERWNGTAWKVVLSPDKSAFSGTNELFGVAAASSGAWAVGRYIISPVLAVPRTLIEHWNGTAWKAVPSPNAGTASSDNELDRVAVVSASDVWAVGRYLNGGVPQSLIEHWNGTSWRIVASPDVPSATNTLTGVAATSAHDVWAVGYDNKGTGNQPLIEHWNGTAWKIVPSPDPGGSADPAALGGVSASPAGDAWAVGFHGAPYRAFALHWDGTGVPCRSWSGGQPGSLGASATSSLFKGIAMLSACEAWAVGTYYNGSTWQTLIERWNGSSWKTVPSPDPGGPANFNQLNGVAVSSARSAWAVGSRGSPPGTLIEHWNGTAWKTAPSPNAGGPGHVNTLSAVAASSASDAWAVGYYFGRIAAQTLAVHWNGVAWQVVNSPDPAGSGHANFLASVSVTSAHDAWAVGYYEKGGINRTLIEHWNGTAWKTVPSPNAGPRASANALTGVAATSADNAWAVGSYSSGATGGTLIEHWNGSAWKIVPSPNADGAALSSTLLAVTVTSARDAWAVGWYVALGRSWSLTEHWNGTAWSRVPSPNPGAPGSTSLDAVAANSAANAWAVGYDGDPDETLALHWR